MLEQNSTKSVQTPPSCCSNTSSCCSKPPFAVLAPHFSLNTIAIVIPTLCSSCKRTQVDRWVLCMECKPWPWGPGFAVGLWDPMGSNHPMVSTCKAQYQHGCSGCLPAEIPVDPNKIPVKSRSEILRCKVLRSENRCWESNGCWDGSVPTGTASERGGLLSSEFSAKS